MWRLWCLRDEWPVTGGDFVDFALLILGDPKVRERRQLNQMDDFDITPALVQIFGDKSSVTMVGCFFTAKEAAFGDSVLRNICFDLARFHQFQEITFVIKPLASFLFVSIE